MGMKEHITLDQLEWEGKSKTIFDQIMEELPPMYRAAVKKKFEVWCNQKQESTITEQHIGRAIEKYAPANIKEKLMLIYKKHSQGI